MRKIIAAAPKDSNGRPCLDASFHGATFEDDANFDGVTFQGGATFPQAVFQGRADFDGAIFPGFASFFQMTIQGMANFSRAVFQGIAAFSQTWFQGPTWFHEATFENAANFARSVFGDDADFEGASFKQARTLELLVRRQLLLDDVVFHQRIQVEATADVLCCRNTQFLGGVQLSVRWAQVVLDGADLAAPSILINSTHPLSHEAGVVRFWGWSPPEHQDQPRLLSVRGANVGGLTVTNVGLRACRFVGAHNLDRLRIEGEDVFGFSPRGWQRTTRQTLAEEHHWRHGPLRPVDEPGDRAAQSAGGGEEPIRRGRQQRTWYDEAAGYRPPTWIGAVEPPTAAEVASLYRALRKGREDSKDEPGAADFYYGEMEMRRHARHEQARRERQHGRWGAWAEARVEHAILWLYWLVSGYALRAWRALATLALVVLVAAVVLAFWGFPPAEPRFRPVKVERGALVYEQLPAQSNSGPEQLPTAVRVSARSATALLRGPDRPLTAVGEWMEITLRFLGPVLLGLALLSLRGRVRR